MQGVGFRAYVREQTRRLGIRCQVWNREDGAVEGRIEGSSPDLKTSMCQLLQAGPGRVDSVEIEPLKL